METLRPGHVLEGRYRIDALLASGGQAHVYKGSHMGLGRSVAVKVLKSDFPGHISERMAKRFEREARLISQLRDPHTITLYDFGTLTDGSMFMVFEFIDGKSLRELVEAQGRIEGRRVHKMLRQTLSSLQEAHAFGVLHRDLKPQNIMVYEHAGRRDQIKLLDFGIAKIMRDDTGQSFESLTGVNSVVGTPRYLAPEIFQGEQASAASDIYSLGLVAYELLVAKPAILGATPFDIVRNCTSTGPIRLPADVRASLELRKIIERMLDKTPARRYQSADEVLLELEEAPASFSPQAPSAEIEMLPELLVEPLDPPGSGAVSSMPTSSPSTNEFSRQAYHTPAAALHSISQSPSSSDRTSIVSAEEFVSYAYSDVIDEADDASTALVDHSVLVASGFVDVGAVAAELVDVSEPTELSDLADLDFGEITGDDLDLLAGALSEDSDAQDVGIDSDALPTQMLDPSRVALALASDEYEPTQLSSLDGLDFGESTDASVQENDSPTAVFDVDAQRQRIERGVAAARAARAASGLDDDPAAKTERLEALPDIFASSAVLRRPKRSKRRRKKPDER